MNDDMMIYVGICADGPAQRRGVLGLQKQFDQVCLCQINENEHDSDELR